MKLAQEVDEGSPSLASSKGSPLAELYKNVLLQFKDTKRHRNFGNLWSRVAPGGNIYRYNGLCQERMRHCYDISQQFQEIADKNNQHLNSPWPEERFKKLVQALSETKVQGRAHDMEAQVVPKGLLALDEFLDNDVTSTLGVVHPSDSDARGKWFFNQVLAVMVFVIQTLGPALVIMQMWAAPSNHIVPYDKMWRHLTWEEALCMGSDKSAILVTVVGTLFVLLVNLMIYNHTSDECENAEKMGRLPADNFWVLLGNFAQSACSILILFAIPLELWSEDKTTGIMMNSMAMLFVFTLDDLTGDVFGFLGEDQNQFQQQAAWNFALLAYCPVNVQDLINPNARNKESLFKITYDEKGRLLTASGEVCETRIMEVIQEKQEDSPLKRKEDDDSIENLVVKYRVSPSGRIHHLPGMRAAILKVLWLITSNIVFIMSWVTPVVWFILNKPCLEDSD